ncbi:hypothetical protein [Streptomyces anulatus]|uniref:hypothetical protein n=1 Tax=Streptomyces anulatus TaxID=1892 RepID=UPI0034121A99
MIPDRRRRQEYGETAREAHRREIRLELRRQPGLVELEDRPARVELQQRLGQVEDQAVPDDRLGTVEGGRVHPGGVLREAELVDEVAAEERRIDGVGVETRQRTAEQDLRGAGQLF